MSEKLKPCPFCGGEANIIYRDLTYTIVVCCDCLAKTCHWGRAEELWNRPIEDQLRAQLAEAQAKVEKYEAAIRGYVFAEGAERYDNALAAIVDLARNLPPSEEKLS